MHTALEIAAPDVPQPVSPPPVVLADGAELSLAGLSRDRLLTLQWRQERKFAQRILATEKGSLERARTIGHAYDTTTRILAALHGDSDGPLRMGIHPRYGQLVLRLLLRQRAARMCPLFFEIGYGGGWMLKQVADAGFPVAGIEVSEAMRGQAQSLLGPERSSALFLGDFLSTDPSGLAGRPSLVYWNDVFEHLPPDESLDYLRRIHFLLAPGGLLVTVTPSWHVRPSDITKAFCPPRTEAAGLHLKEYTLREVRALLAKAGFRRIVTPLAVTPRRFLLGGRGLTGLKCALEGVLERLPFSVARLLCRGFGLSLTIAEKA